MKENVTKATIKILSKCYQSQPSKPKSGALGKIGKIGKLLWTRFTIEGHSNRLCQKGKGDLSWGDHQEPNLVTIEKQPKQVSYHYAYTSIHPHMHTFLEFSFKKNNENLNLTLNYNYSGKGCWVCSYKDFYIPFSVFLSIQMRWLFTIEMLKQLFSNVIILWVSSGVSIMELFYHLYFNFYVLLYSKILYQ